MAIIKRVRCEWTGTSVVGPAVSTFYFSSGATGFQPALVSFFNTLAARRPAGVNVAIPNTGDELEASSGDLTSVWTAGVYTNSIGTGAGVFVGGVGMRIVWNTNGFTNGRRVRGSTYFVPVSSATYDTDGTLAGSALADVDAAAGALLTAVGTTMVVWTRPRTGVTGGVNSVTGKTVPDKVSWLRSRRT